MQLLRHGTSRHTFNDVRGNGVARSADLAGQLKPLGWGKPLRCEPVNPDEQVVSPLPRNEVLMSKHAAEQAS